MNSIVTMKYLSSKNHFANREWYYNWRTINNILDEDICSKVWNSQLQQYSLITKTWSSDLNSEWICRIYLAAKMIMSSTLQINSLEYTESKNVRIVSSYLKYYSVLSCLRAIVYTLPTVPWNDGQIIEISHNRAINIAFDYISKFNKELAASLKNHVLKLKACRELISYRAPTSGDDSFDSDQDFDITDICTLFAEIAQFNSELLESSIIKNANEEGFIFESSFIEPFRRIKIGDFIFDDREDAYRLNYLRRKYPLPPNILHIMTEGHTEDFFGAWDDDEDPNSEEIFNTGSPSRWQTIFDIP